MREVNTTVMIFLILYLFAIVCISLVALNIVVNLFSHAALCNVSI
jgi:hypothetical protein